MSTLRGQRSKSAFSECKGPEQQSVCSNINLIFMWQACNGKIVVTLTLTIDAAGANKDENDIGKASISAAGDSQIHCAD